MKRPRVDFASASVPAPTRASAPAPTSRQSVSRQPAAVEEPEPPTPAPRYSWADPNTPQSPTYGGPVSLVPANPPAASAAVPPLQVAAAPAPTPAPPRPTFTWAQRPTAARIAGLYPARAAREGIGGRADLNCTVRADLGVTCTIASETPAGSGFGQAALSAVTSYRAQPTMSDGASVVGARTRLAIVFQPAER
ncbi:MAG: energy transducer TonB [Terricaulis sp.]